MWASLVRIRKEPRFGGPAPRGISVRRTAWCTMCLSARVTCAPSRRASGCGCSKRVRKRPLSSRSAHGAVVGVLSVVGDSPELGLPSDAAFKPELDAKRRSGARLCELTNQAVAEMYRNSAVATQLMRCAIAHGMKAGYDESVATVSPGHNGFYELLGFQGLGSERSYSTKLHEPVIALSMDLDLRRRIEQEEGEIETYLHEYGRFDSQFLHQVADWARAGHRAFPQPGAAAGVVRERTEFFGGVFAAGTGNSREALGRRHLFRCREKIGLTAGRRVPRPAPIRLPAFGRRRGSDDGQEELALGFESAFA